MNAIIPLNISAIRVNANDSSSVTESFSGKTINYAAIPYKGHNDGRAYTGDTIYLPIQHDDGSLSGSSNSLSTGIHLHWELPDYFRRGVQKPGDLTIKFPHVPNRWMVVRYLRVFNGDTKVYGDIHAAAWIVESDFIASEITGRPDKRTSVPLPVSPDYGKQPFRYQGRVVNYADWDPANAKKNPQDYLSSYKDLEGNPCFLTAAGFVGTYFSSYYPECNSVFGFFDDLKDLTDIDGVNITDLVKRDLPVQFINSYQVFGWIDDEKEDPLIDLTKSITGQYNKVRQNYIDQKVPLPPAQNPASVFGGFMKTQFKWVFNENDIAFTLNQDKTIASLTVPTRSLCSGILQGIVWDMEDDPAQKFFLTNPETPDPHKPGLWTDTVKTSIGNTITEALSALIKSDLKQKDDPASILDNYEYLLNALQAGLLSRLEKINGLFQLDESLHSRTFSRFDGGRLWVVKAKEKENALDAGKDDLEASLPLDLAEELNLLNRAQKNYDQGREKLTTLVSQLFMDWTRYITLLEDGSDPNLRDSIRNFLVNSDSFDPGTTPTNELNAVLKMAYDVGFITPGSEEKFHHQALQTSLAEKLLAEIGSFKTTMKDYPQFEIQNVPASNFWLPNEPVIVVEGDRIEPVRRNGDTATINCRLSNEIIDTLSLVYKSTAIRLEGKAIQGIYSALNNIQPMLSCVDSLLQECFLVNPMMAPAIASAIKKLGGPTNPVIDNAGGFENAFMQATGGWSPSMGVYNGGLFDLVRSPAFIQHPAPNPIENISAPLNIDFSFTNSNNSGWAPDPVGWSVQENYSHFETGHMPPGYHRWDPFLPVFLVWNVTFTPLLPENNGSYTPGNITDFFEMDPEDIDNQYRLQNGKAVDFTTDNGIIYANTVSLSKKVTFSLSDQIDNFVQNYPQDLADTRLGDAKAIYNKRHIMSQGLSGFNSQQILKKITPQVPIENLIQIPVVQDIVTSKIKEAALKNPAGDWYDLRLNSRLPIHVGSQALGNFGTIRSGFFQINNLSIVDVFGQQMQLSIDTLSVAKSMQPRTDDPSNKGAIFLPPRLEVPTRLWFRWISAMHDKKIPGFDSDFVEMNSHPSTSPICGWLIPNHLDESLLFYDYDGSAIGSFGIEHNSVVYRTRPGNTKNQEDKLCKDIGDEGSPTKNPTLATFMWFVNKKAVVAERNEEGEASPDKGKLFFQEWLNSIEETHPFINPGSGQGDRGLGILIGSPLALTRTVIALETGGGVVPVTQAQDQFIKDVTGPTDKYIYDNREMSSSANVSAVNIPVRLGDLTQINDGLVSFLISTSNGYLNDTLYAAAGPVSGQNGISNPSPDTLMLQLNAEPIVLNLLIDPRASVHATTGILPVMQLSIPPDMYVSTMRTLAVTFFTHPVLQKANGLSVALPAETGFSWDWVGLKGKTIWQEPLKAEEANEFAKYSYTPQTILEGWLKLSAAPDSVWTKPLTNNENDQQ